MADKCLGQAAHQAATESLLCIAAPPTAALAPASPRHMQQADLAAPVSRHHGLPSLCQHRCWRRCTLPQAACIQALRGHHPGAGHILGGLHSGHPGPRDLALHALLGLKPCCRHARLHSGFSCLRPHHQQPCLAHTVCGGRNAMAGHQQTPRPCLHGSWQLLAPGSAVMWC